MASQHWSMARSRQFVQESSLQNAEFGFELGDNCPSPPLTSTALDHRLEWTRQFSKCTGNSSERPPPTAFQNHSRNPLRSSAKEPWAGRKVIWIVTLPRKSMMSAYHYRDEAQALSQSKSWAVKDKLERNVSFEKNVSFD